MDNSKKRLFMDQRQAGIFDRVPININTFALLDYRHMIRNRRDQTALVEAGGRVYLGKDARLPRDRFRRMYPEWEAWKAVRDAHDPGRVFQSELGRRLGLS